MLFPGASPYYHIPRGPPRPLIKHVLQITRPESQNEHVIWRQCLGAKKRHDIGVVELGQQEQFVSKSIQVCLKFVKCVHENKEWNQAH